MTDHIETSKIRDLIKDMQADMNVQLGGEFYNGYDTATADWKHHLESLLPPRTLADLTEEERADCQWRRADTEEGDLVLIVSVGVENCFVSWPDKDTFITRPFRELTPRFDLPKLNPWQQDTSPRPTGLRTVTTEEEYDALPVGSIVTGHGLAPYVKLSTLSVAAFRTVSNGHTAFGTTDLAGVARRVLREGWKA